MMKRLVIAVALLLTSGGAGLAAECVNPHAVYSPLETKISVLFDEFRATFDDMARCNLAVDAHQG